MPTYLYAHQASMPVQDVANVPRKTQEIHGIDALLLRAEAEQTSCARLLAQMALSKH